MHRLWDGDLARLAAPLDDTHHSGWSASLQPGPLRDRWIADLNAGLVVATVLIPSAMAYALLAGLPPHVGLYASILPLLLYPLFGSNRAVSVGPVTIVSLMTASTLGQLAPAGSADYIAYAASLALLSAICLALAAWLNFGRFIELLRPSALGGFLTAVGFIIGCSQLKSLVGVALPRVEFAPALAWHAVLAVGRWNFVTLALGLGGLAALVWRADLTACAVRRGWIAASRAPGVTRAMPLLLVAVALALSWSLDLSTRAGIAVVGAIPTGLPAWHWPSLGLDAWRVLIPGATLMSLIGYCECISVVKGLQAKGAGPIDLNRELAGLAAANLGASVSGGYPVSGGTVRSVVNFNAGAATPYANAFTALIVLASVLMFGRWFAYLPMAILAAIVIAASLSIIDWQGLRGRGLNAADHLRFLGTLTATLALSPELGLAAGLAMSLMPDAWPDTWFAQCRPLRQVRSLLTGPGLLPSLAGPLWPERK